MSDCHVRVAILDAKEVVKINATTLNTTMLNRNRGHLNRLESWMAWNLMLKGRNVSLRLMEREDLPILREWVNDPNFVGEFEPISQETQKDLEKQYDALTEGQWFFIEKKDGTKIGYVAHFLRNNRVELGYSLVPEERGKGYGTEAVKIAVDYLFLSKSTMRIQVETDPENMASQRILQKVGFRKEGVIRKSFFCRGEWRDTALFSILREEWKEPRIIGKY